MLMLFPIVPHIGEAIYAELKPGHNVATQRFPVCDPAALVQSEIELMLQVNGKLRGSIRVAAEADKATIEATALACEAAQKQLNGAPPQEGRGGARPSRQHRRLTGKPHDAHPCF